MNNKRKEKKKSSGIRTYNMDTALKCLARLAGLAQSIFFSERYFSMGIALRPENQYRSLSFTDAVSMLDKR